MSYEKELKDKGIARFIEENTESHSKHSKELREKGFMPYFSRCVECGSGTIGELVGDADTDPSTWVTKVHKCSCSAPLMVLTDHQHERHTYPMTEQMIIAAVENFDWILSRAQIQPS